MTDSSKTDPLSPDKIRALENAFKKNIAGDVRFDQVYRAMYSTDASVYQIMPLAVVIPKSRNDILATVALCNEFGISITARGGGTSQAGQAVGAGIQLDFSKYLNQALDLDIEQKTISVEPGIVLDELNAKLKPHGLHLPLDLSTSNRATIGGMIANNSAGTRSVIYGKTLDYVQELSVVLADGSLVLLKPQGAKELDGKCRQNDLEGGCYEAVRNLATEHADEIARRYPKLLRRVGGYNLDEFVPANKGFNLSKLLVGSEGTLGLVVEARLKVVPLPNAAALCVLHFETLLAALEATPLILKHQPSAVELVDRFILNATKGKPEFESLRSFITGDPEAVLIVEFMGETNADLSGKIDGLRQDKGIARLTVHFHTAVDADKRQRIWKLRQAALGLSMSHRGDAKAISYVEDTAVAPERLCDYIKRFKTILEKNETQAGFYAHASVGLLHIRPVVNMKTADGVEKFQRIAEQISDLILEFGGALSGEHGDGLARSPFQEKMFGPKLYQAFRQIKRTFDPHGLFNPGKIVDAPALTEHLKFGPGYQTRDLKTTFDFYDYGGISRAAEQCSGVGSCRKILTGTMCPSYMATRDETDSTRGRANALRMAISGQLSEKGIRDPSLYPVLDLCLECKACKTECPTGVDIARIKSEFLHQYYQKNGAPLRARLLAQTAGLAHWGSRFAPLSNRISTNVVSRWLNEKLLGLDRRRIPPAFAPETFWHWWSRQQDYATPRNEIANANVAIFPDTFTNYYEPEHAMAAVDIARRHGKNIVVPAPVCCGRPLISKGFLQEAANQAKATTAALWPIAEKNLPIVFCEPGCYSAVRDDHPYLLDGELKHKSRSVAEACVTFEEWANLLLNAESVHLDSGPRKILLHGHCHQKALVGMEPSVELLSKIPDSEIISLDSGCCGMAGSFGYEKEHYEISRIIGERKLFPAVRDSGADSVVVAPGFSCRHQIKHFTGKDAVSSMVLLAKLLGD